MSYVNSMKATEDILTLVESWDAEKKTGLESSAPIGDKGGDSDPFGTVALDDINDTVETNDNYKEPEDLIGDKKITLSEQEKSIVRENLSNMLSELKGDDVSDVALEVIIGEVAKDSAVLTEADESNFESPAEKSQVLDKKEEAIQGYIRELLKIASDNGGELPTEAPEANDGASEESTETPEEKKEEGEEGASEGEKKPEEEAVSTDKPEIVEGTDDGSAEAPESVDTASTGDGSDAAPVEEGVCAECGDNAVVDVPEDEVIKVVDDSEVRPVGIDGIGGEEGAEGVEDDSKYATKADVDEIKAMLQALVGNTSAVLESAGLIKGATINKNHSEGGTPSLGMPKHSSEQKKITPNIAKPGFKIATLKNLTDKPSKVESNAPFGKEDQAAREKSLQFKKGERDHGKSQTEPEGGMPTAPAVKKPKETPKPTEAVKAAVVRESVTKSSAKTWLAEAARLIREGK